MRSPSRHRSAGDLLEAIRFPWFKRLLTYISVLFFVCLADSVMTYFSPVYIQHRVNNHFLMGIIIAASSMIGLLCDIVIGGWFAGKSYRFFFKWSLVVYFLFPLSYLILPSHPVLFFIPMAVWGIAYEFGLFADFHFINEALDHPHHSLGWSLLKTISATAYMLGPLLSSFLMEHSPRYAPMAAVLFLCLAAGLNFLYKKAAVSHPAVNPLPRQKQSILVEFKIWRLLLPRLWPVILFIFIATVMDSTFWTVGAILSETLRELHPFGGFLLTVYVVPSLIAGFLGTHLATLWGKKRTAFIGGLAGGASFIAAGLIPDIMGLLFLVFVASFCMGAAVPQIYAAIEDYIERLGHSSNALVGLENSATSLSFIVGPIAAGAIAALGGDQKTFAYMGAALLAVSFLALIIVPRKIMMPQRQLQSLEP